jgi:hypothetical protein
MPTGKHRDQVSVYSSPMIRIQRSPARIAEINGGKMAAINRFPAIIESAETTNTTKAGVA